MLFSLLTAKFLVLSAEVYQQSIGAVCILDWPKETMLLQFVSIEADTQQLIKAKVHKWKQTGVWIIYRHRLIRIGYNAGNLKSTMNCDYVKDYEFVAIFEADFQPTSDLSLATNWSNLLDSNSKEKDGILESRKLASKCCSQLSEIKKIEGVEEIE
ncbi:hypothetical protein JHK82_055326 [Glycine max]|nr:hypothetical protein JHK86_055166 [Glycine max]KAG4917861.1 hypothetical protein JHK85_056142 [Glycine max]KAG5073956.1 hypothetical protein JHK84_055187 [Glycine max]KAG5076631.1 hypothetical protein JHK82_055326 [Glycine max]